MSRQKKAVCRDVSRVLVLTLVFPALPVWAAPPVAVAAGSGNTAVYTSANGVTVVNVNTANGAGLSHNKYNEYNVPANGVVLNNGNSTRISRSSQLAGQVAANMNLNSEARVILNEVVSTNRSVMSGFTEVLGGRADVVVANPNGITCGGCGFINTDRVSLVTGKPNLAADGSLRDFSVSRGDILINGAGLNGSGQQYLDLVSRSIKVDGQINVPALRITAGNNVWAYGSALVTGATTPEGEIPAFAFDSTVLGGMYAGRIKIVATEAGVGVRLQGDAAATADDFMITSSGHIAVGSKLSAARDLALVSSATGADAIRLNDAGFTASRNLSLAAASGGAMLSGGVLMANNDLSVNVGTLVDAASASAITDNNKRYAGGALTLAGSGAASLSGVSYGSVGALSAAFSDIAAGGGAALYSGSTLNLQANGGNLALADAAIRSAGDLNLIVDSGSISFASGSGVQSTAGNLSLFAGNGLSNAGTLTADSGTLAVRANGTVTNSGTLHASGAIDIADLAGAASEDVGIGGGRLLGGTLAIKAKAFSVTGGGVVETKGSMNLVLGRLSVGDSASRIAAATSGSGTATISSALALVNYGVLHSGNDLSISAPSLDNKSGAGISAAHALTVNATGELASQGALYSDGTLYLRSSGGNLALGDSSIRSAADMTLIADVGSIAFTGGAGVQSTAGNLSLSAASGISNGGTITADSGNLTVRANGTVGNSGTIHASGAIDIADLAGAASEEVIVSGGKLLGTSLAVKANALSVTGGGDLETSGDMTLALGRLTIGGVGDSASRILAATSGVGTGTINTATALTNYGVLFSGQNLIVNAPALSNTNTGGIAALDTLTVNATSGDLFNQGSLYAGKHLNASASGTFTNDATLAAELGTIDSGGDMTLAANVFVNNSAITAAGDVAITAATFKNEVKGGDTRVWGAASAQVRSDRAPYSRGYSCGPLDVDHCNDTFYKMDWYRLQSYSGGTPGHTPQIIGGGSAALTIKGFNAGSNLGGLISAGTVTLSGNSGATFTNDDLSLLREDFSYTYTIKDQYYAVHKLDGSTGNYNQWRDQSGTTTTPSTISSLNAGIRATTLNMSGFALVNKGSPYAKSATPKTAAASGFSGLTLILPGNPATGYGGLTLSLPSNPNGFYVVSKNPKSRYLVEINPQYTSASAIGTDYLATMLGFNADTLMQRIGDAGYENYLVRQQLIGQTGANLLKGYGSESTQMQSLLEQGASQGKSLGLKLGTALSASQQASLKDDMVWLVETTIGGQKVLAPVVYLSASTRAMIEPGGAVIAASQANLNLTSLSNTGGTIVGTTSLKVTTQGDITNTSGTIKGGDVSLTSTAGNVVNKTLAETTGDDSNRLTTIGKTATIASSGTLNVDAAKDISNLGARIASGGDATLSAGGNVTLDTVEDKRASQMIGGKSSTHENSTDQIRSDLSSGGNLKVTARGDITVAGSTVSAAQNATLDAGGDLNIVARDNTRQVVTTSENEGFGVGGGLYGKEKTTTDAFQSRSVGSSITAGGDLGLSAVKTATIQGSAVNSAGNTRIEAQEVQVLASRDIDRTTTTKETESILSISAGDNAKTNSLSNSAVKGDGQVKAGANASATNDGGGVDFSKTTKTETSDVSTRAVVSSLNAGKNLSITSRNDITLEGAKVKAAGDVDLTAQNVNILAAQDTHTTTSKTTTTKTGLYASTTNAVDAKATAGDSATAVLGSANANAGAAANANAASSTSIDVTRSKTTETETVDVTNQGSTLAAGGNLRINSAKTLTVQGSDVSGDKGVDVKANDMLFLAAHDTHSSTTKTSSTSGGLYLDGNANASATANASANAGLGANAGAKAEAGVKSQVSVGVQVKNTQTEDSEGSSTARVSSITSGSGSITRTAVNKISDVGTAIDAAGDFGQSAKTIDSRAAENTTYSSRSSVTNTGKVGVYAKAEAGVSAEAGASAGLGLDGKPKAEAGASSGATGKVGAGVKASYTRDSSESSASSSDAVVSTIKAGGKVSSTSIEKTTFEGTTISAGKGVELEAGSIDFAAARNTTASSSSVGNVNASVSVGVSKGSGKGVDVDVAGGTSKNDKSSNTSTAVAGAIDSGGNIVIKTGGDARFEGTNIAAVGDTRVDAGGNLIFDAARDTTSSNKSAYDASASVSTTKSSNVDASVSGGFSKSEAQSSSATAGSINTGGKLTLTAGKAASFEGTNIAAGGDATIIGKDGVTMSAARSTASSEAYGARVSVDAGSSKDGGAGENSKSAGATLEGNYSRAKSSDAQAGSVSSGGKLLIVSNKDVTLEGTNLAAQDKASIQAGGSVNFKAAESTSESVGFSASLSASADKADKTPTPAAKKPAAPAAGGATPAAKSATTAADPAKPKSPAVPQDASDKKAIPPAVPAAPKPGLKDPSLLAPKSAATPARATPPAVPAGPKPELKDPSLLAPKSAATPAKATPPAVPAGPKPALKDPSLRTPKSAATPAKATPPAVPAGPKPGLKDPSLLAPKSAATPAKATPPAVPAGPKPELKDPSLRTAKSAATPAKATPPAVPAGPKPGLKDPSLLAPKSAATPAKDTPPAVPAGPKPELNDPSLRTVAAQPAAADEAGLTTEKNTSVAAGAQFQMKNKTTQTAGSISAGAGGVEIVAAGGDVNLVGTNINTVGNADISAKRDVNISATKNTDMSFGASVALASDKKSEAPTKPAAGKTTPAAPAAKATPASPASAPAVAGKTTPAAAAPAAKATPVSPVTAPAAAGKTTPAAAAPAAKATPVSPATAPAAAGKTTPAAAAPAAKATPATGTSSVSDATKPAGGAAATLGKPPTATTTSPLVPVDGKDPDKFSADVSIARSSDKDDNNKSSTFVGVGGGGSVTNRGAAIKSGGKVTITSGGKTTLTNTEIKAAGGEVIDAAGGVERRTEKDSSVLNASTNSGPASTGQGVSKVPTASTSPTTGAPVAPASATDATQNASGAPQSAIKAAQGGSARKP
jgi:filamentous hemagglutinin